MPLPPGVPIPGLFNTLKKSAVFRNFGFHHFLVVKRPLMPVRMELDVDAGSCVAGTSCLRHDGENFRVVRQV